MAWFQGNNIVRAAELAQMARMKCERTSRSRWDLLNVEVETPGDPRSPIVITREGRPNDRRTFAKSKDAQKYVQRFYDNLRFNGSGAPNDIFLDSLEKTTSRESK